MQARTVELQRIGTASAIGEQEIERRDAHHVVARPALERIRAAIADQRVVAGAADEGLRRRAAGQRVVASRAQMRHRAVEIAAEDDVALALIGRPAGALGIRRPDDQVGEAVAVHVPRRGDRVAAAIVLIDADQAEAVGPVQRRKVERRRPRPARLAVHHIALALIVAPPALSAPGAPTIRSAKPSPFTSPAEETERRSIACSMPIRRKPLVPSSVARSSEGVPAQLALPNTT